MPTLTHPSVSQTLCNLQAGGDALNIETSWAGRPLPHQAFIFNPWLCLVVSLALERAGSPRGSLHSPDGGPDPSGTPLPGASETCLAPTTALAPLYFPAYWGVLCWSSSVDHSWGRRWLLETLPILLPDCTASETCPSSGSSRVTMRELGQAGGRSWEAHNLGLHATQGCPIPCLKPILVIPLVCPGPSGSTPTSYGMGLSGAWRSDPPPRAQKEGGWWPQPGPLFGSCLLPSRAPRPWGALSLCSYQGSP